MGGSDKKRGCGHKVNGFTPAENFRFELRWMYLRYFLEIKEIQEQAGHLRNCVEKIQNEQNFQSRITQYRS